MAERGVSVAVLERESQFRDRVRGEWIAPWGVAETRKLGLYATMLENCAHEAPFWKDVMQPARDFRTTTPQGLPVLTVYHPSMQETVLESARNASAEVWRDRSECTG
jgi:2-polyprenyl-6-methoxyphenol hydroxylase-like FAD-dependent oxidoreductase